MDIKDPKVEQVWQLIFANNPEWSQLDKAFCNEDCINRYLRARKQDPKLAAKLLQSTLQWRRDFGVDELRAEQFNWALETGRMYLAGHDSMKHPIMITRKNADKVEASQQAEAVRHLVFTLETAVRAMLPGQDKWVWIMDMKGYSRANSPPLNVSLQTLKILSEHYPALWPFIDQVTREKIVFIYSQDLPTTGEKLPDGLAPQVAEFCKEYLGAYQTPYDAKAYRAILRTMY